jgi:hypothetical protein
MSITKHLLALASLFPTLMPAMVYAQAPASACIQPRQGAALFQRFAPIVLRAAGKQCAAILPARTLKINDPAFLARYDDAAKNKGAEAVEAFRQFAPDALSKPMIDSILKHDPEGKMFDGIIDGVIAEKKPFAKLDANDCLIMNRFLTSTDALQPADMADIIMVLWSLGSKDEKDGPKLCPLTE